jgi:hypothetical protein
MESLQQAIPAHQDHLIIEICCDDAEGEEACRNFASRRNPLCHFRSAPAMQSGCDRIVVVLQPMRQFASFNCLFCVWFQHEIVAYHLEASRGLFFYRTLALSLKPSNRLS